MAFIHAEDIGVRFHFDRQRRSVTPALARLRRRGSITWGLRNVTFSIEPGEGVAVLGPSGAGKTSLLRTIAGVYVPDTGHITVHGRVGSLLSIDGGLLGLLTGEENSHLLGVLAGLSRAEARAAVSEVWARSGLGNAFCRPVMSYSQGMRARLGFSVVERARPQILLLDEGHEALDHEFRNVVEEQANSLLANGGIVIAAGHDLGLLDRVCNRAFLLEQGTLRASGEFGEVRRMNLGDQGAAFSGSTEAR